MTITGPDWALDAQGRVHKRFHWIWGLLGALIGAEFLLAQGGWQTDRHFHLLLETVATILALCVGAMALIRFYAKADRTILIFGTSFIGAGLLDGYHMMVTSTWIASYFPSGLETLIPWSWIASRVFLSVMLLYSFLAWRADEKEADDDGEVNVSAIYLVAGLWCLVCFLFFFLAPLPVAYFDDYFFHRPEDFVPGLFFALALGGYLAKGKWQRDFLEFWVVLALVVSLAGQTIFMTRSAVLFDGEFDSAHLLKVVSYVCVLIGLLGDMLKTHRHEILNRQRAERLTEELRGSERLATLGRLAALGRLGANLSHDLRHPLATIRMSAYTLGTLFAGKSEPANRSLELIDSNIDRCDRIISDMLDFTRDKKLSLETVSFDAWFMDWVREQDLPEGIRLETELKADIEIQCDPDGIGMVMNNLFTNACDSIAAKRAITPTMSAIVRVETAVSNKDLRIRICDTGAGFGEAGTACIFEPLFSTRTFGAGLGLPLARKIVEQHGGTITAAERKAGGAIFDIRLPADKLPIQETSI